MTDARRSPGYPLDFSAFRKRFHRAPQRHVITAGLDRNMPSSRAEAALERSFDVGFDRGRNSAPGWITTLSLTPLAPLKLQTVSYAAVF